MTEYGALDPLGWHVISGEQLLTMLRRVRDGEDPDMVYAEEYVNADREEIDGRVEKEINTYWDLEEETLKITRVYDNTIELEIIGIRDRKFSLTADDSGGGYDTEESWVPAPALVLERRN